MLRRFQPLTAVALAVVFLSLLMEASADRDRDRNRNRHGPRGGVPKCGEGDGFFRDFMKCDASIHYCFEYRNASCVGPDNWVCVHNLNRRADQLEGEADDSSIKNTGYGNTRCCGGDFQSPIDIPTEAAQCDESLPSPSYVNRDLALIGHYENTGYYSKFFVPAEDYVHPLVLKDVPFTCAVPGSEYYVFANVHIHSGIRSAHWSAHFVNGNDYDGEFHLVHMRSDFWSPGQLDMRCASQTPNGLAVIAVFLSLTEGEDNEEVDKLLSLDNLQKIRESHANCDYDEMCDLDGDRRGGGSDDDSRDDDDDYCEDDDENGGDDDDGWFGEGESDMFDLASLLDRRKRRAVKDGPVFSSAWLNGRRKKEERERERDTDGGDREGRKGRKVRCFCRRRRWDETFLRSYLKRGEEMECRLKYRLGINLFQEEEHTASGDTQHQQCNQHGNGEPCGDDEGVVNHFSLQPGKMLPKKKDYWQYFGSLTTPPCSEVVNWIVMKEPIRITQAQLDHLHLLESRVEDHLISEYGDVRPIQPLNGRTVTTNSCGGGRRRRKED